MTLTDNIPPHPPAPVAGNAQKPGPPGEDPASFHDGTRALLQAGFWMTLAGVLALVATGTLFGGIGIYGPHTNAGWLAFMFALMAVPFGLMLLLLGAAKWLRNRHRPQE